MNANGLLFAASITSQTEMPIRSHNSAISLTKLMLMKRNVFSTSFEVSATSGELRRVADGEASIARVDPLRCEDQEEVLADLQTGRLQDRQHHLAGGPRRA